MAIDPAFYVVATPIGNLQDISLRAVDVLQSVELIAAENTRHSSVLMRHFSIDTSLIPYHDYTDNKTVDKILELLSQGKSVALISDAGTPLISDPGYRLVSRVHEQGYSVVPIPGASAVIAALCAGGLATDRFVFEGFLPAKSGARKKALETHLDERRTLVFYEAPHRIVESLSDMVSVFGEERIGVLARELTKQYETIRRLPLGRLLSWVSDDINQRRGEIVVMLEGAQKYSGDMTEEDERVLKILAEDLPLKQAATLAAKITGRRKNFLYHYLLTLKDNS
tara:strand:+ start:1159 stop:2004 length:846 start_codon:yes stop_codon:yes gene_type:complete